jgi:hypothetical protein
MHIYQNCPLFATESPAILRQQFPPIRHLDTIRTVLFASTCIVLSASVLHRRVGYVPTSWLGMPFLRSVFRSTLSHSHRGNGIFVSRLSLFPQVCRFSASSGQVFR